MKTTKVIITVMIEASGEDNSHYKDQIATDNIIAAADWYNQTMNHIDGGNYNDFPIFRDEAQEVDFCNGHTDAVADQILKSFKDPAGTFGSDKLNKIVDMYHKMKNERTWYFNTLMILLLSLLIAFFYVWGGIC